MKRFVGRKIELSQLEELKRKKSASLVVIRGRRRIGKSRLIEQFSRGYSRSLIFSGLPPAPGVTAASQREEFARQMASLRVPRMGGSDWGDLFADLAREIRSGEVLVVLDEITWMGDKDPTFLGKLKTAWDLQLKKNPRLTLILSGSNSYWIEENILSSTGFFGRISFRMTLDELPLPDCDRFWGAERARISAYEKFKLLGVMGGVPRYLEEIQPHLSAEQNIERLAFREGGLLFNEFEELFSDLFSRRQGRFRTILTQLVDGARSSDEIAHLLGRKKGGDLSAALEEMCDAGLLSRDHSWSLPSGKRSRLSLYRPSDNYIRFYLKVIEPNRERISAGAMQRLPRGWAQIMGLQFENLVLSNRLEVVRHLGIPLDEVIAIGPYTQTATQRRRGCQVDLLIQTRFNQLYLCEIKFRASPISASVVAEVKERMDRLQVPKNFSIRPILIHASGLTEELEDRDFFAQTIDFSAILSES